MSTILADALREAAALLEARPDLPTPYITSYSSGVVNLNWYLQHDHDGTEQKHVAALILKAVGGKWDKSTGEWDGGTMRFTQKRERLSFDVQVHRDAVCERFVTGTETVTREVPDPDALAKVPTTTVTETVEKVEWRCEPILSESVTA